MQSVEMDCFTCKLNLCKFCIMGGQSRVTFTTSMHKIKSLLDLIQHECVGTFTSCIHGGACYDVTFIYDFSQKVWVYFLKNKSEIF